MIRMVITASALAAAFSVALAQDDPIAARQALMKSNGQQAALGAKMVKGEELQDRRRYGG